MRYLYNAKVFRLREVVYAVIKFRSTWSLNYSIISVKNKTMPNHKQQSDFLTIYYCSERLYGSD